MSAENEGKREFPRRARTGAPAPRSRIWTATSNYWPARDALTRSVKVHLDNAKISIPFPQMDVHMEAAAVPTEAQSVS